MATKKQLEDEVGEIRALLYQERENHKSYVRHLRETAYKLAQERMRVNMVFAERPDGNYDALTILRFEETGRGVNVVVANAEVSRAHE